jgi:hypothetical protein
MGTLDRRDRKGSVVVNHIDRLKVLAVQLRDFSGQQSGVQHKAGLTTEEKVHDHAVLAQRFAVELGYLWGLPATLAAAIEETRRELFTGTKRTANRSEAREREIRDNIKMKTQTEINDFYGHAIQAGRDEQVLALTTGPLGSLVSPATQHAVEELQAKERHPEGFAMLDDLVEVHGLTVELVRVLTAWLKGLGADAANQASVVMKPIAA